MPVNKYKSFQDARDAQLVKNPDEKYYKMLSGFYNAFGKIFTKKFPHGVFKFKNIEEAQKQKEEWLMNRAKETN